MSGAMYMLEARINAMIYNVWIRVMEAILGANKLYRAEDSAYSADGDSGEEESF